MLVAILVVLLPALLIVAWFQRVPEAPIAVVDPAPIVARAAAEAPFAVAVPTNLPEGWVCTRARWTPQGQAGLGGEAAAGHTLALGYLSPDRRYFAVDQRDTRPASFIADVTREGSRAGESKLDRLWLRYTSSDGRTRSLVLQEADHATVVSGDVEFEALEAFVGTLEFRRG